MNVESKKMTYRELIRSILESVQNLDQTFHIAILERESIGNSVTRSIDYEVSYFSYGTNKW